MAVNFRVISGPRAGSQTLISRPLHLSCFSAGHRAPCSLPGHRVSTPPENNHAPGEGL